MAGHLSPIWGMRVRRPPLPKISVYVRQEVYDAAKAHGLDLPRICQSAILEELADDPLTVPTILRRAAAWFANFAEEVERREAEAMKAIAAAGLDPVEVMTAFPMNEARAAELRERWKAAGGG